MRQGGSHLKFWSDVICVSGLSVTRQTETLL